MSSCPLGTCFYPSYLGNDRAEATWPTRNRAVYDDLLFLGCPVIPLGLSPIGLIHLKIVVNSNKLFLSPRRLKKGSAIFITLSWLGIKELC